MLKRIARILHGCKERVSVWDVWYFVSYLFYRFTYATDFIAYNYVAYVYD